MVDLISNLPKYMHFEIFRYVDLIGLINLNPCNKSTYKILTVTYMDKNFTVKTNNKTSICEYIFLVNKKIKFTELFSDVFDYDNYDEIVSFRRKLIKRSKYNFGREPKFIIHGKGYSTHAHNGKKILTRHEIKEDDDVVSMTVFCCLINHSSESWLNGIYNKSTLKQLTLDLSLYTIHTDETISKIMVNNKQLQSLTLNCHRSLISDNALQIIGDNCKDLISFSINCSYNQYISDDGLSSLAKKCNKLEKIGLNCFSHTWVSYESILYFARHCKNLVNFELYCSCNPNFTGDKINEFINECKKLKFFTLYGSTIVNGFCKEQLKNNYPHIKFIF
jgi:hypothetical protein